jgi:5,10-methylene-tetrahydrofolate dehydrogenase/methenyl tetrahydrofolate cyclohydrolase
MATKKISGTSWANIIREEIKQQIKDNPKSRPPCIACIIVGNRPDSATYVTHKESAAKEIGMIPIILKLEESVSQEELINRVKEFNDNDQVDGILVQLPLPSTINERIVLSTILPTKDVDGVGGPIHMGNLAMRGSTPDFVPCTAKGCIELLKREKIQIEGTNCVVLGRSNIVGIPVALLLQKENATVTMCHSKTKDLAFHLQHADIIVVAIGQPNFVKKEWIKPNAVVIDVGINRIKDPNRKFGFRLVGDVEDGAIDVCSKITPVPGGVGPMTIAMLLQNTYEAYLRNCQE